MERACIAIKLAQALSLYFHPFQPQDMLPTFPTIPTDSLHRFLAITGLIVLIGPPLYIKNKTAEIGEQIIHLNAESEIIKLQSILLQDRRSILYTKLFGRDISNQPLDKQKYSMDSINKLGKGVNISIDSALVENKKIMKITVEQEIIKIHLNEKLKIIEFNNDRIDGYTVNMYFCLLYGVLMTGFGFSRWYKKES